MLRCANHFLILVVLIIFGLRAFTHLISQHLNISAEANNLSGILRVASGEALYPPVSTSQPLNLYLYPPLHAYLVGPILSVISPPTLEEQVRFIRLSSLFFTFLLFFISWKNRPFSFFLVLALLGTRFSDYVTTARNDVLALLLEVSVIVSFSRLKSLTLPVILSLLSFLVRPTGGTALLSIIYYLFTSGHKKQALFLAGSFGSALIITLITLSHFTQGKFIEHVFWGNQVGWRPWNFHFWDPGLSLFFLTNGLALFIGYRIFKDSKPKSDGEALLRTVVKVSFVIGGFMLLRKYSDTNYFFTGLWALGAILYNRLPEQLHKDSKICFWINVQLLLIITIQGSRTFSAWKTGQLDFRGMIHRTENMHSGLVYGDLTDSLILRNSHLSKLGVTLSGIHLKPTTDISRKLNEIFEEVRSKKIPYLLFADRKANDSNLTEVKLFSKYKKKECWTEWLCLYE